MTIETKYNIGDPCFTIKNNKIYEGSIRSLSVHIENPWSDPVVNYGVMYPEIGGWSEEEKRLMPTRETLIATL